MYKRQSGSSFLLTLAVVVVVSISCRLNVQAQSETQPIDGIDARTNTNGLAKQLGSADPHVRLRSAEALARLAAIEQKKLVEGYQLQEKNKDVRLALDWALYRMGKPDLLFRIVDELDSGRQQQAIGYLSELENPAFLYPFLKKQNNRPRVNAGLLHALGRIGNAETVELIEPYLESLQPYVAEAAEIATDEINKRLGQAEAQPTRTRPRSTAKPDP
jgi:HEAT repeat protein